MTCPHCHRGRTVVVVRVMEGSSHARDFPARVIPDAVSRMRSCGACGRRFWTVEHVVPTGRNGKDG